MIVTTSDANGLEDILVGLPLQVRNDKPILLYHPAADRNYISSWQVLVDHGHEFVQIVNDTYPAYPEYQLSAFKLQYWTRLGDMNKYTGQVYARTGLGINHRQLHIQGDAREIAETLPLVDIYYDDWPFALLGANENCTTPTDRAEAYLTSVSQFIQHGGFLIFDLKNMSSQGDFVEEIKKGIPGKVEFFGAADWLDMDHYGELRTKDALVFQVSNESVGKIGFREWCVGVLPEYHLDEESKAKLSELQHSRHQHVNSLNPGEYWEMRVDHEWHGTEYWCDAPALGDIADAYSSYLKSIRTSSGGPLEFREYNLENGAKLKLIHADLFDHLLFLYANDYTVFLRANHVKRARKICPLLVEKLSEIESWGLRWSGEEASNIVEKMFAASPVGCKKYATIAHGTGDLEQLKSQVNLVANTGDEVLVFHIHSADYQE